jgi:ATP-dependent Clp protease ATP-binding subunit ClpC
MAVLDINFGSERAVNARLARYVSGIWITVLTLLAIALILGGVTLVVTGFAVGWFVVSLAALPAMYVEWYNGELKSLPVDEKSQSVDAWLEGDILSRLPANATPKQIAEIVGSIRSGQFFAIRFGITSNFLQNIASDDMKQVYDIWIDASEIREKTGSPVIHGGIIIVALLKQFPQHEALLAQIHLEVDDLLKGVMWYDHIQELIDQQSKPRRTGGVARDWSFGYVPLLRRFGINLSEGSSSTFTVPLQSHEKALSQMIETLGSQGRQNIALVGGAGVGKTTILRSFADRLLDATADIPSSLRFRQVYLLDSSALISAAPGRGELEGLVMRVLGEAYGAKNIIICLDNAQLFFEEAVGSVDLTNVLLPILEAGNLRVILTMDEQRLLQIGQRNPSLINALNRISVAAASKEETIGVMQDQAILIEYKRNVSYMYQSLNEAYRLSERYIHDLQMPGRALKLLESSAGYSDGGLVTANSVQQAIEQTLDVKVGVASGEAERETLLNLEDKIHERMINQTRAVGVVSDALRRARAGVRNQDRPIGTFLFLGPTGVGKTELAKALADVYFGGEDRIIRLDLNEYVSSNDVARLIADGADDPNSLTARAMKQPFSVVLLDEIEKAHPNVLNTLLQLLDEGILRDIKNREISFRDAIVIATSNAGADRIREYIERGYQLEQFEKQFTDELINTNQFKPEFLNRFDEIVVFRPLNKPELVQVIDLILAGINKTLSFQKVSVNVAEDAKLFLVDKGYDPRLGARPMRRVVQRAVENTVAKQMLGGNVTPGSTIEITLEQVQRILGAEMQANAIALPGSDDMSLSFAPAASDSSRPYLVKATQDSTLDFAILPPSEEDK